MPCVDIMIWDEKGVTAERIACDSIEQAAMRLLGRCLAHQIPAERGRSEAIRLESGQTATIQATITHDVPPPFWTPDMVDAFNKWPSPFCEPPKLIWTDSTTESETVPANYQVDQGPNGWHAYFFEDCTGKGDCIPDLESDGPYPTRELAKAWCTRHAAGEELEPARCERCKMPMDAAARGTRCTACVKLDGATLPIEGELVNGQKVAIYPNEIDF